MKLFFISDVHCNYQALKSIINHAKLIKSDVIVCSGDISGYFLEINEVVELLRINNIITILGNHDAYLTSIKQINKNVSYYGAFLNTKNSIFNDSFNWLKDLKASDLLNFKKTKIQLYHGGPNDLYNQYVFPDKIDCIKSFLPQADVFVFGHSHLQFVVKMSGNYLINPGSVGLPRNGDFRAHGLSYDNDKDVWEEHRICYDLDGLLLNNINKEGFNSIFIHNIMFGRSSKKDLKKNQNLLLSLDIVNYLQNRNLFIINTIYGAIIQDNDLLTTNDILYIASYNDDTIELTTSNLFFNWQKKNILDINIYILAGFDLHTDSSGSYIKKIYSNNYDFENQFLNDIEKIFYHFKIISRIKLKNILI